MENGLAQAMAEAALRLHDAENWDDALRRVVDAAGLVVPHLRHVALWVGDEARNEEGRAASTPLAAELDSQQVALQEGPLHAVLAGVGLVSVPELRHEQRWKRYVTAALRAGVRGQLAARLSLPGQGMVGVLGCYTTDGVVLGEQERHVLGVYAAHASSALRRQRTVDGLVQALESRQVIGQAIGVLMARYAIDSEAARAYLWRASSHENVRVHDLAQSIVEEANANARPRRRGEPADAHYEDEPGR